MVFGFNFFDGVFKDRQFLVQPIHPGVDLVVFASQFCDELEGFRQTLGLLDSV
jgi:hypothetical protein